MFQLSAHIEAWKNSLCFRETLRKEDIEELEQHVRDSISECMNRGLTEEESFWVATGRLGETGSLACEFNKVNEGLVWARRLFWMLGGFLLFEVCRSMIQAVGSLGQTFAAAAGGDGIVMGSVAAGLTFVGWCTVLWFLLRSGDSRGRATLLGRFLENAPGLTIGVCVGAALIVMGALNMGGTLVTTRVVAAYDFGQASIIAMYTNLLLAALLPSACLLAMIALRRRIRGSSAVE